MPFALIAEWQPGRVIQAGPAFREDRKPPPRRREAIKCVGAEPSVSERRAWRTIGHPRWTQRRIRQRSAEIG
jgi:hypothetical protein